MKPRILIVLSVLLLFSLLTGCNTADTPSQAIFFTPILSLGFPSPFLNTGRTTTASSPPRVALRSTSMAKALPVRAHPLTQHPDF